MAWNGIAQENKTFYNQEKNVRKLRSGQKLGVSSAEGWHYSNLQKKH